MRIVSLLLKNIRSYETAEIEFPSGITLLEGDIGSGKSTILYAIEFALFGLGDLKPNFLLRTGATDGSVELLLDIEGSACRLQRTLTKKKDKIVQKDCVLEYDGVRTSYSPAEMKAAVLKLLNFKEPANPRSSSVIYRFAVFTPQEAMKSILDQRVEERLQTLRKAFGIEEYRTAQENAKLVIRRIEDEYAVLSGTLRDFDALVAEHEEKKQQEAALAADMEQAAQELKMQQERSEILRKERDALDAVRKQKAAIENDIDGLERLRSMVQTREAEARAALAAAVSAGKTVDELAPQIAAVEQLRETLAAAEEKADEAAALERQQAALESDISNVKKTIDALESELESTAALDARHAELARHSATRDAVQKQADEAHAEVSECIAAMNAISRQNRELAGRKEHYEQLEGHADCPTCGQQLDEAQITRILAEITETVTALETEHRQKREEKERLEAVRTQHADALAAIERSAHEQARIEEALKRRDTVRSKLAEAKETHGSQTQRRAALETQRNALGVDRERIHELKRGIAERAPVEKAYITAQAEAAKKQELSEKHAAVQKELAQLHTQISEKNEALAAVQTQVSDEAYAAAVTAYEQSITAASGLGAALAEKRTRHEHMAVDVARIAEKIAEKERQKERMGELFDLRNWLGQFFLISLETIERHMLTAINREFDSLFQKWFDMLISHAELSVSIDESFTPLIRHHEYDLDVRALSGGERSAVALAYRLALNLMVKKVCSSMNSNLLILDEPTDGFSKEQLYHMRDVFDELNSEQIIIVSHERELEGFADTIFQLEKKGDVSYIESK